MNVEKAIKSGFNAQVVNPTPNNLITLLEPFMTTTAECPICKSCAPCPECPKYQEAQEKKQYKFGNATRAVTSRLSGLLKRGGKKKLRRSKINKNKQTKKTNTKKRY
jgi:hypothetical protein